MKRFLKSFQFALSGIGTALKQTNLRIHMVVAVIAVTAGCYFGITESEWLAVIFSIGLVVSMELMNTAMEQFVDFVSPHHQLIAGKVKDIAAGAVLVSVIAAVVIGVIVFWKYI